MPIHDMKCNMCGHTDEIFIFINEEFPTYCPVCKVGLFKKLYTPISKFSPNSCIFNGKWPEITPEAYAEADRQIAIEDRKNVEIRKRYKK